MRKHTPGPWKLERYDRCATGDDFQWGGIWAGPVLLDGCEYGQAPYEDIKPKTLERMEADARLIAAAPDMLDALLMVLDDPNALDGRPWVADLVLAAIAKATGDKIWERQMIFYLFLLDKGIEKDLKEKNNG